LDFVTREQLPIVVLLMLPGIVSMKTFDLLVPGELRTAGQQALEVVTYGLLNFGLWYVVVTDVLMPRRESDPWVFRLGFVGIFFVSPIALGIAANAILRWKRLRRWIRHPVPTAWDYHFGKGRAGWVLIRLKSGLLVGGLFGPESFASSYPHRDLYLQQTWTLDQDGRFLEPVQQSKGVIVSMEDCETLEFFSWDNPEEGSDEQDTGSDTAE
jgi:hypothetical protein